MKIIGYLRAHVSSPPWATLCDSTIYPTADAMSLRCEGSEPVALVPVADLDVEAAGVRAVIERVRQRRDIAIECAAIERAKTTKIASERFFRHYGLAILWSDVADDLLDALGESRDGLHLPWDDELRGQVEHLAGAP